ncbi:hypothetical protein [Nitrosococcus wardiae]|uniref:hypothetical protein n=1 Tax=Nitrosococcus wardiae TaxID=1814290 RepID=UPI003084321A
MANIRPVVEQKLAQLNAVRELRDLASPPGAINWKHWIATEPDNIASVSTSNGGGAFAGRMRVRKILKLWMTTDGFAP